MAHYTPEFFSKHHANRNILRFGNPHLIDRRSQHPKPQTVRNILAYSKALEVKPSESVEHLMIVLN